jgi:hypothetical protein
MFFSGSREVPRIGGLEDGQCRGDEGTFVPTVKAKATATPLINFPQHGPYKQRKTQR